ncbi:hypothetical protein BH09PAT2_BH09PAT2_09990 [soil metagenome]
MNRETIFAIVFGIILGIGVGFFVLFQTNRNDKAKVIPVAKDTPKKQVATAPVTAGQIVLKVSAPENNTVVVKKDITIKGKAPKNSLIVLQSAGSRQIIKTEKEDFSIAYTLSPGENLINISAYSGTSSPQETTLQIYYVEE